MSADSASHRGLRLGSRHPSEINDFVGDVLTPWDIPCLHSGWIPGALKQDADSLTSHMAASTEAHRNVVMKVLERSLVGRRLRIHPEPEHITAFQFKDEALVPVERRVLPAYDVLFLSIELVGSQGQMTQVEDSDLDAAALMDIMGTGDVDEIREEFFIHGHEDLRKAMVEWLQGVPDIHVHDDPDLINKSRVKCTIGGMEVDILQALAPEHLRAEDARMVKLGRWIKAYSLNLQKTRWVANQPSVVRDASRLAKLWARSVSDAEASTSEDEDERIKINTYAVTILLAALHRACPGTSALELCSRAWRILVSLRVDLLAVVSFDETFSARLLRGPRFHAELALWMNLSGISNLGLLVEDIVQPDRFYPVCEGITTPNLAKHAATALQRLSSAQTWEEVIRQGTSPFVPDILERFSSSMQAHWSFFRGLVSKCPNGHQLSPGVLEGDFECDECHVKGSGMHLLGCRRCDFDLCESCAAALRMTTTHFPLPCSLEAMFNK